MNITSNIHDNTIVEYFNKSAINMLGPSYLCVDGSVKILIVYLNEFYIEISRKTEQKIGAKTGEKEITR